MFYVYVSSLKAGPSLVFSVLALHPTTESVLHTRLDAQQILLTKVYFVFPLWCWELDFALFFAMFCSKSSEEF